MTYRGVAYYPEAWPADRWDEDIQLMLAAGINLVRMGEFAWARLEPEDNRFELDWWVGICERFRRAGIDILACTPSAAPPAWLTRNYPECVAMDDHGRRHPHGSRRHYCPSSPRYRELANRVTARLADAVQGNPAVIAWQIDNEIAPVPISCVCPLCAEGFRNWLRQRYGTLDALNEAWGNAFWSGDFSAWDQIEPPQFRVSWKLDYRRFENDLFTSFIAEQATTLRTVRPDWRITTNQWAGLNPVADAGRFFEPLDLAAYDGYWDYYAGRDHYSAVWDLYRNIKQPARPFWLAETNAWNPDWTTPGGLAALRPWAYQALAKGSDAHIYFRWRQSPMGEEDHPAILDWSGRPGPSYAQVQSLFLELASLGDAIQDLPLPDACVAILFDYDSTLCGLVEDRRTMEHLVAANTTLNRLGVLADILPVRKGLDLSRYKLVIATQLEMVDPWLAETLSSFVRNGGLLLAQTRLSTLDRNGKYRLDPMPAGLTELFGILVVQRGPVACRFELDGTPTRSVAGRIAFRGADNAEPPGAVTDYMERLQVVDDAVVTARYEGGAFAGEPAITIRSVGDGWAMYQAFWSDAAGLRTVMVQALARASISCISDLPPGVDILRRGPLTFYLNHGPEPVVLPLVRAGAPLLGSVSQGNVQCKPFGVYVVRESTSMETQP